jgi:hypothetical protein
VSRPPYSTCFYAGPITSSTGVFWEYSGPDVVVLRSIIASTSSGDYFTKQACNGLSISADPGGILFNVGLGQAFTNSLYLVESRIVMPASFEVGGETVDTAWEVIISGYLLTPG